MQLVIRSNCWKTGRAQFERPGESLIVWWRRNRRPGDAPAPKRPKRPRRPVYEWLIPTIILVLAFAAKGLDPPPMQVLRNYTFDTYQQLKPRPYGGEPIRI